jgi:hypothetical protein
MLNVISSIEKFGYSYQFFIHSIKIPLFVNIILLNLAFSFSNLNLMNVFFKLNFDEFIGTYVIHYSAAILSNIDE